MRKFFQNYSFRYKSTSGRDFMYSFDNLIWKRLWKVSYFWSTAVQTLFCFWIMTYYLRNKKCNSTPIRDYQKYQTHVVVDGMSLKSTVCVLTKPVFNSSNSFSFIFCKRFCSYSEISYMHENQIDNIMLSLIISKRVKSNFSAWLPLRPVSRKS